MRDAAHELRLEPRDGLQQALSLLTVLYSILSHMQEADLIRDESHHSHSRTKAPPRRATTNGGSLPIVAPGGLIHLKIDEEREYEVNEAADFLKISPQTVRKMITDDPPKLKAERRGKGARGRWCIQGAELLSYAHLTDDPQP